MTVGIVALALALSLSSSSSPSTRIEAASRAVERAKVHVAAGEYEKASAELAEAFDLDPNPAYLYARAQVERFGGDCALAVRLYRAFLAEDPPEQDRALAERYIAECEGERRREAAVAETPPPPVIASPPPAPEQQGPVRVEGDATPTRPWASDVTGGVLLGTGIAGLAVGLGFTGRALVLDRSADRASATQDEFAHRMQRAITFNRVGWATLGIGTALVAAGILRYGLVARRARAPRGEARLHPLVVRF